MSLQSLQSLQSFGSLSFYNIKSPPLISTEAPVIYPAASEARKQIRSATSTASPKRRTGKVRAMAAS